MITPIKNINIKSTFTKDETKEKLISIIDNVGELKFQNKRFSFRKYEGYFKNDHFVLRRVLKRYRYSGIPIVKGYIDQNNNSTIINLTVRPNKFARIFMIFMNIFLFIILIIGLISFGDQFLIDEAATIILLIQIGLILIGNLLYRISFKVETYILEKDFRKLLQENTSELKWNKTFEKFYDWYSD